MPRRAIAPRASSPAAAAGPTAVDRLDVSVYDVPTDAPESDGTIEWDRTTLVVASLDGEIAAGVPVVGLEPSCVSVFRDELVNLLPHVEHARRLSAQTFTLAEILEQHADRLPPLRLPRAALVHGHCHHKAIVGMEADRALLDRIGVAYHIVDSGCCGMAGAFGFEEGHYGVSMAVGERVLLPAVRSAPHDTLIVADGFSCREQIAQATPRRAIHTAELVRMAMGDGAADALADFLERALAPDYSDATLTVRELAGAACVAAGLGMAAARALTPRRRG